MTERDQEEQDLRIEVMTAQLDQIRFEMEQARRDAEQHQRDFEADKLTRAETDDQPALLARFVNWLLAMRPSPKTLSAKSPSSAIR